LVNPEEYFDEMGNSGDTILNYSLTGGGYCINFGIWPVLLVL